MLAVHQPFTETISTIFNNIISNAYVENFTVEIIISDISYQLPIFYISSDVVDVVTQELPLFF